MPDQDNTENLGSSIDGRTLAALSLALAAGRSLADVEIDLTDPEQCRFGAYTLVERIGAGGMGLVYRAHQLSLERDVAIKILNMEFSADSDALARFRFEAKSAAALNHPNIVQILEIGEVEGVAFIAMQLVRGETLADRIQRERLGTPAVVALMLKLCDAVGYAHRLQLLHLDLKPANVLIDERGEPMVADFGLARHMNAKGQVEAQEVSGTPGYMAPEQVLIKEFRLSVGTDIYALGAILYELLCGQPPHGRGSAADVLRRALAGQIPSPRSLNSSVPKDLEAICLKCLSLSAADRYASVEAFAEDLRRFANGLPVSVRSPTRIERLQHWYAREPKFAAALAALLLFALAGSFVFANLYRASERERVSAEGFARIISSESPEWVSYSILPHAEGFKVPVIDCTEAGLHCGGGLEKSRGVKLDLPTIQSLRTYVQKLASWGDRRLSAQLDNKLHNAERELYARERADAAIATNTADGLLFGYLLSDCIGHSDDCYKRFDRALAKANKPWQVQLLAQNCLPWNVACKVAIERFKKLDPDNAAAWMFTGDLFPSAAFSAEGDRRLLRAVSARHLDHHAETVLDASLAFAARLMPTLAPAMRITPVEFAKEIWHPTAENRGVGDWQYGAGGFDYPIAYCHRSFTKRTNPVIEDACRAIFAKVDDMIHPMLRDELMAATMALRMSTDPTVHAQAWRRLKNARWIYSVWAQLPVNSETDATMWVKSVREHGELAYLKSLVAKAGLPLEAPEEFVTREPLPWPRHAPASTKPGK